MTAERIARQQQIACEVYLQGNNTDERHRLWEERTGRKKTPFRDRLAEAKANGLFIVPKIWVNDDGSLGEFNDVVCTGIEHKMGIHGNATCSLALGGKGRCVGELLGEENKGMRAMFLMMNEARLLVGMQGFCCASASYMNAINYARERVQGNARHSGGRDLLIQISPLSVHGENTDALVMNFSDISNLRSSERKRNE